MRRYGLCYGCTTAAILNLLASTAGGAWAQEDMGNIPGAPDRLKIAVGGIVGRETVPGSSDRQGWLLARVSYDVQKPSRSRLIDFAAFLEAATARNRERLDAGRYRDSSRAAYGAGVLVTMRLSPPNPRFGVYATAGAGGYLLRRSVNDVYQYIDSNPFGDDTQAEFTDALEDRNKFSVGYKLGGGVRFARGMFLEATYHRFGAFDDDEFGGFGITFGLRL